MTCRQCGGSLQFTKDAEQIVCQHCGTEYLISFVGGAISIKLLSEGLKKIQVSTDKTASELALARLKREKDDILLRINNQVITPLIGNVDGIDDPKIPEIILNEPGTFIAFLNNELDKEYKKLFFLKSEHRINLIQRSLLELFEISEYYEKIINEESFHINRVRTK